MGRYNRSSGVFGFFSLRVILRVGVFAGVIYLGLLLGCGGWWDGAIYLGFRICVGWYNIVPVVWVGLKCCMWSGLNDFCLLVPIGLWLVKLGLLILVVYGSFGSWVAV